MRQVTQPTYLQPPLDAIPWVQQSVAWEALPSSPSETVRTITFGISQAVVPSGWRAWCTSWRATVRQDGGNSNELVTMTLRRNGVPIPGYVSIQGNLVGPWVTDQFDGMGGAIVVPLGHDAGELIAAPIRLEEGDSLAIAWQRPAGFAVWTNGIAWILRGWLEPVHVARPGLEGVASR